MRRIHNFNPATITCKAAVLYDSADQVELEPPRSEVGASFKSFLKLSRWILIRCGL